MRSTWNRILCGCLGLVVMAGQAWALPAESSTGAMVRAQWNIVETAKVESPLLLSAFELPSLHEVSADGSHPESGSCLTHAIMQGTWFDSALMQLVPPQQLVQPYKKRSASRSYVALRR